MKKYRILKIYEPDFGCEGLLEGQQKLDDVVLVDEVGNEIIVKIADEELYVKNLNEGDEYLME